MDDRDDRDKRVSDVDESMSKQRSQKEINLTITHALITVMDAIGAQNNTNIVLATMVARLADEKQVAEVATLREKLQENVDALGATLVACQELNEMLRDQPEGEDE